MDKLRQCYETLGVTPGASWDQIKQAYKDSVKVWHPDRFENDPRLKQKAIEKIKEINGAYEKLSNFFGEYGAPNFSNDANPNGQKNRETSKDFESDPLEQKTNGFDNDKNNTDGPQNYNNDELSENKGKPWRRFWARTLDTLLLSLPVGFLFGLFFPQLTANTLKSGGELVIGILIFPFVMLCEASILGATGTTFGKWLLNIKLVRKKDGNNVNFPQALKRSILLWVKGLAFGLPLISLFSMGFAAGRIRRNRTASWDDSISADVHCGTLHGGKVFIAVFSIACLLIIYSVLQSASKPSKIPSNTATSAPAAPVYVPAPNPVPLNNDVNNYYNPNSIRFIVQDDCNDGISIQYRFFDVTNNLWWPSSDQVYITNQQKTPYTHELTCSPNANICFGATTYTASPTVFWGLGINNDQVTNIATSCVSCGSVPEKRLNFACPANNKYIKQTQGNSATNKKKIKSNLEVYEPPPQSNNNRSTTNTRIKRDDYRIPETYNRDNTEPPQQVHEPVEFSSLSPNQQMAVEHACFEAKVKGKYFFDECIKSKLSRK